MLWPLIVSHEGGYNKMMFTQDQHMMRLLWRTSELAFHLILRRLSFIKDYYKEESSTNS